LHPNPFEFNDERSTVKKLTACLLAVTAITMAVPASAQFSKPENAIKYRQSGMFMMAQNFGRVAGMSAGRIPFDAKVAADSAAVAEIMSKLPWDGFVSGTSVGQTKAKPEIWTNKAKFDDNSKKLQAEMTKLVAATKSGNLDNIKLAVSATGAVCKSCHDEFQAN
jgi:cytochrome c556